jgi:two-component system, cell cycle sensor histidine kinase and response regulator CckA
LESQLAQAQKMEAAGTLAGGVAHDLNNILSGLVSYPELLLMDLPVDSPIRGPIETIHKSGKKAAAIVQDLLTLARRGVPIHEVVNLNDTIRSFMESPECFNIKKYHPNVLFCLELKPDLLNIIGSSIHLSKAVMNLISNGAEAITDGGTITLETKNIYIDSPIDGYEKIPEGEYVLLTVKDSGIGISAEDLNKIFEPFYTKKRMGRSGTGLGMAVVWGTVKDLNGFIDVKTKPGAGTIFYLYIPITRQKIAKKENAIPIEKYMGDEEILIIDDVEEQRDIAAAMLEKLGYSVSVASSGEESLKLLSKNKADILILDMIMEPGMDGLETYNKAIKLYPKQKAIIASGYSETARVKEAQRLGAGKYLKKPYTLEKLGVSVRAELNK